MSQGPWKRTQRALVDMVISTMVGSLKTDSADEAMLLWLWVT